MVAQMGEKEKACTCVGGTLTLMWGGMCTWWHAHLHMGEERGVGYGREGVTRASPCQEQGSDGAGKEDNPKVPLDAHVSGGC